MNISLKNIFQGRTNSVKNIHDHSLSKVEFGLKLNYKNIKSLQPICIDYDPNNMILAIGYENGMIKIQGKPGFEHTLFNNDETKSELKSVIFIPNKKLISVFYNQIIIWNLENYTIDTSNTFDEGISSVHYSSPTNTIYIGLVNGYVKTMKSDFDDLWSVYDVFNKENYDSIIHEINDKEIVGIELNPKKLDILAIGYKSGQIIEWNLNENKVMKSFFYCTNLITISWSPNGTKIYASYSNGDLCIFRTKKSDSKPRNILSQNNSIIKKIIGVTSSDGSLCFLLFSGIRKIGLLKNNKDLELFYMCDETQSIVDLYVLRKSNKSNIIVTVTDKGNIIVHKIRNMNFGPVEGPNIRTIDQEDNVIFMKSYEIPDSFYQDLLKVRNIKQSEYNSSYPLSGAITSDYLELNKSILLTLHNDYNLNIWDISRRTISLLYSFKVENDSINFVLCRHSRKLFVGSNSGMIYVYLFCVPQVNENDNCENDNQMIQKDEPIQLDQSKKNKKKKHKKIAKENKEVNLSESEDSSDKEEIKKISKKKKHLKSKIDVPSSNDIKTDNQISPSGFLLSKRLNIKKSIKYMKYEESDDILLIATFCGDCYIISVKDLTDPKLIYYEKEIGLSITNIMTTKSLVKDEKANLVLVFCETGKIIVINLDEKRIINKIKRNNLFIHSHLVNPNRLPIEKQWNEINEVVFDENIYTFDENEISTNNEQSTISKADLDEKVAEIKQGLKSSNSLNRSLSISKHTSEQYIILCSINELCIINIPQLTFARRIKLDSCMGWFGIINPNSNESDSYIYGIDHHLKLHFFRMKDLKSIKIKKSIDLHDIGIDDISPLQMKVGINQINDQLIVYKNKELFILNIWHKVNESIIDKDNENKHHKRSKTDVLEERKNLLGKEDSNENKKDDEEDIKEILSETKEKLNERGNRLEALAEKTSMMRSESEQFSKLSRQLLEKSKK